MINPERELAKLIQWGIMRYFLILAAVLAVAASAAEASQENSHQTPFGTLRFDGSGDVSGEAQRLSLWTQLRQIGGSPWFAFLEGRVSQEKYRNYDLHRWGGSIGVGRALSQDADLDLRYRGDRTSVFDVSPETDLAIRSENGLNETGAWGLFFQKDRRDDPHDTMEGFRLRLLGELALEEAGGDYNFGRLEADWAWYGNPFWEREGILGELTFVEHFRVGWVENFGSTEDVPFFERYFMGGASTVRGHRSRWLSPRGIGDQFIGGEFQLLNNVEVRLPVFKEWFNRRLSVAGFFDMGRAFRRLSDAGDLSYGLGAGLRYVVHLWKIHGVLRADYGFNLAPEGDDATSALHITFGMPF